MSSETPADRGGSSSADEGRPRRAYSADPTPAAPSSPTTPVRPRPRLDDRSGAADGEPRSERDGERQVQSPGGESAWDWVRPEDDSVDRRTAAGERSARSGRGQAKSGADRSGGGRRPDPLAAAEESVERGETRWQDDNEDADDDPTGPRAGGHKARGRGGKGKGRAGGTAGLPNRKRRFKVLQGLAPTEPRPEIPDQSHLPPEQRTDLAVRVQNLHVTYRTSFEKKPTLRQAIVRLGRGQRAVREIEALKDISFDVRTGTSMGIIGRNGAGKSTLMRTMAGILPPTSGTVEVWGRASTLLALGVGFNNSLSGRENIILGGLASGLSRAEVEDRANEIAEWTELGDFIDMPMRTYSSGMFSRVAFSVAVHMEPDILMIDEALSTGDAHFREKASEKMAELRSQARAMFLVSHGLGSIKELCNEAIWIDKGRLMKRGEPDEVVDAYLEHMNAKRSSTTLEDV